MPRLDYMPRCAYRHAHRERVGGIVGMILSLLLLIAAWPITWFYAARFQDLLSPFVCAIILSSLIVVYFVTAVRAVVRNGVWETRIEQGKLYLSAPRNTQVIEIASISKFVHERKKWMGSGMSSSMVLLNDGTTLHLDDRHVGLYLQRSLKENNPHIRFITVRAS
jgi:hypothetical protein